MLRKVVGLVDTSWILIAKRAESTTCSPIVWLDKFSNAERGVLVEPHQNNNSRISHGIMNLTRFTIAERFHVCAVGVHIMRIKGHMILDTSIFCGCAPVLAIAVTDGNFPLMKIIVFCIWALCMIMIQQSYTALIYNLWAGSATIVTNSGTSAIVVVPLMNGMTTL